MARLRVHYKQRFSAVTALQAGATTPDGERHFFSRSDATDLASLSKFVLYSDIRELQLEITPAPPGTLIEYSYTLEYREPRLFLA